MPAREELIAALKDTIRMLDAVRYLAGLGKGQVERFEKARALIDKAERGVKE